MKHETTKCTINVDKNIAPIVQYILDFYQHSIIPISCCEESGGKPFIMVVVRNFDCFNKLLRSLFVYTDDTKVEYYHNKFIQDYLIVYSSPVLYMSRSKFRFNICFHMTLYNIEKVF